MFIHISMLSTRSHTHVRSPASQLAQAAAVARSPIVAGEIDAPVTTSHSMTVQLYTCWDAAAATTPIPADTAAPQDRAPRTLPSRTAS